MYQEAPKTYNISKSEKNFILLYFGPELENALAYWVIPHQIKQKKIIEL